VVTHSDAKVPPEAPWSNPVAVGRSLEPVPFGGASRAGWDLVWASRSVARVRYEHP
jgi:hypothetical protein